MLHINSPIRQYSMSANKRKVAENSDRRKYVLICSGGSWYCGSRGCWGRGVSAGGVMVIITSRGTARGDGREYQFPG